MLPIDNNRLPINNNRVEKGAKVKKGTSKRFLKRAWVGLKKVVNNIIHIKLSDNEYYISKGGVWRRVNPKVRISKKARRKKNRLLREAKEKLAMEKLRQPRKLLRS